MRDFKDLKIAVARTGYVGLSIATLLSQHHKVTAVDIIPEKVELINNKKSPILNCTPFVRQYGILSNKWGVLLCQKEYQTNDIRRNSKNW